MQAFMFPATARAMLAQSRAFTAAKRKERKIAEAQKQFERIGWTAEAARELAEIHIKGQQ